MIPLDSDAEAIVHKLVGQRPPSQQLATYNLVSPQDIMRPIFAFVLTRNEYPFEREELIDFVHRNVDMLRSSIDFLNELKGTLQDYNRRFKSEVQQCKHRRHGGVSGGGKGRGQGL